jgi:V8-like Glu-specific endopeptidase
VGRMEPLGPSDTFPHVLPVAANAPTPGTRVWLLGYRWNKAKDALADDRIEAHVTRVIANHLIFVPAGQPGSSGSCVLNDAGQVVGINEGGFSTDEHEEAGLAVGVWSSLRDVPK